MWVVGVITRNFRYYKFCFCTRLSKINLRSFYLCCVCYFEGCSVYLCFSIELRSDKCLPFPEDLISQAVAGVRLPLRGRNLGLTNSTAGVPANPSFLITLLPPLLFVPFSNLRFSVSLRTLYLL